MRPTAPLNRMQHMTASTTRRRTAMCLLMICLTACGTPLPPSDGTAADRLREPTAAHADALASGDIEAARRTGYDLIAALIAYFGW